MLNKATHKEVCHYRVIMYKIWELWERRNMEGVSEELTAEKKPKQ